MESDRLAAVSHALNDYLGSAGHVLRPRQQKVLEDISADIAAGSQKGHIRFPTGGGKGIMIGAEMEALLKADARGDLDLGERKILILTPRKMLVDDLYDRFAESGLFPGIPADAIGRRHSDVPEGEKRDALNKPVLITTYAGYMNLVRSGEVEADAYPVVLLDEVHRTRGEIISGMVRDAMPHAYVQGWTATDRYENGHHVGQEVLGREDAIHTTSFKDAVEDGVLCPVINHVVRTNIDPGIASSGSHKDYRPEEIDKIVRHHARDKMAVEMLANHVDDNTGIAFRDQASVFYCAGVKHAENVAEKLNAKFGQGYAATVSGETPKEELREIMRRHADPDDPLQSITNADLLIEGWDAPHTSLCFMLRPTKSPILAEQTGGRVMRLDPQNPDKTAFVITFWDDNMPDLVPFGEVIGGYHIGVETENRSQRDAERNENGEAKKPEWQKADIDLEGMEITTDIREIANFTGRIRHDAMEGIAPDKPDEKWHSTSQFAAMLSATGIPQGRGAIDAFLQELSEKFHAQPELDTHNPAILKQNGQAFRVGNFKSGSGDFIYFHEDDIDRFRLAFGQSPMLPAEGWCKGGEFKALLQEGYDDPALFKPNGVIGKMLGALMTQAVTTLRQSDEATATIEFEGQTLNVGIFSDNKSQWVSYHKDDMDKFRRLIDEKLAAKGLSGKDKEPSWVERVAPSGAPRIHPDSPHITEQGSGHCRE